MSLRDYQEGEVLLINKPLEWTSFDVVNKIRSMIKYRLKQKVKVGHAGTLDPLATGLLIICTGKYTKQILTYQGQEKEYTGTFYLGATTPSYDMETEVDEKYVTNHITEEMVRSVAKNMIGEQEQVPPAFSAKKINGKKAYELARKGKETNLQPRVITIHDFEIEEINFPEVKFRTVCSKGTYIRSLAHDFGKALNSGAYLSQLCRTRIGNFSLDNALEIGDLEKQIAVPG